MKQVGFSPSRWAARKVWAFLLWILRRPWIKRFRRRMIERQRRRGIPEWLRIDVQDRVAMRYGRNLLALCFGFLFYSLLFSGTYVVAIELQNSGAFDPPERVKARLDPNWARDKAEEALRQ